MNEIKPIIGICADMCPPNEIQWREENGLLHELEISKGSLIYLQLIKINSNNKENKENEEKKRTDKIFRPKADKRKTVKQYSRSSAGQRMQTPEELRPIRVLTKVVEYLFVKVSQNRSLPWNIIYDFIFDRLRSVRQDMSIQYLQDFQSITLLEQCVRFHIYSSYHFGDKIVKLFDYHINEIHLRECLQSLLKRYDSSLKCSKFRPLFESIYLIYNLGSNDGLLRYGTLSKRFKNHHLIKKCFKIGIHFENGFYFQAINSMMSLKPTILLLLSSIKLQKLHFIAIERMSFGYNSANIAFPISLLSKWLCPFECDSTKADIYIRNLCANYGLLVDNENVFFNRTKFNKNAKPLPLQKWSSLDLLISESSLSSLLTGRKEIIFIEEIITID